MDRFTCIHGHFYQPPRESPWLEAIEIQDSAFPYHDWNERVTAECYAANAVSRIWDTEGRIAQLVNNYASISFDFGPTVLLWMQKYATEVNFPFFVEMKLSKSQFLSLHNTSNGAEDRREWGHARLVGGGPERFSGMLCSAPLYLLRRPAPGLPTQVRTALRSYSAGLR